MMQELMRRGIASGIVGFVQVRELRTPQAVDGVAAILFSADRTAGSIDPLDSCVPGVVPESPQGPITDSEMRCANVLRSKEMPGARLELAWAFAQGILSIEVGVTQP